MVVKDDYVRQTRCNLDGFTMISKPEAVEDLLDVKHIVDASRPALE